MAIKIDLLPGYVKLRRDLHRSIAACVVVTGLVVGGLLLALQQKRLELETASTNLSNIKLVETKVDTAISSSTAAKTQSAPIMGAISFMTGATKTGAQRAILLDMVRRVIYQNAVVSSIDLSDGSNVAINATVTTPDEYANFLLDLRKASDAQGGILFKGQPVANGPGGFANGAVVFQTPMPNGETITIRYPLSVNAKGALLNPVQIPAEPSGAAAAAPAAGAAPPPP